jgi:hypothetical protein
MLISQLIFLQLRLVDFDTGGGMDCVRGKSPNSDDLTFRPLGLGSFERPFKEYMKAIHPTVLGAMERHELYKAAVGGPGLLGGARSTAAMQKSERWRRLHLGLDTVGGK